MIQSVAPSFGVEASPVDIRDAGEIERTVTTFARSANGGLIVTSSRLANVHRDLIIGLADKLRLPAVYSFRFFVSAGGLISYGLIRSIRTEALPATSIASSRVRGRPICQCRGRLSTN